MGKAVISEGMSAATSDQVVVNPVALDGTAVTMGIADEAGLKAFIEHQGR
jgi:hypothetical protein